MACWPTHAIICEMLMNEPLEPQRAMVRGALDLCRAVKEALPGRKKMDISFQEGFLIDKE